MHSWNALDLNLEIDAHINLVPISLNYLNDIHQSFDEKIIEFLPLEQVSGDIKDTKQFIELSIQQKNNQTDLVWVILNNKLFAGCCGILTIQSKTPHFGIWIKSEQQGKGIGKKVVHHMLDWGITHLDVNYIKYPVDKRNHRSTQLIKDLNLKLYDHYLSGDQKVLQTNEYRMYKDHKKG